MTNTLPTGLFGPNIMIEGPSGTGKTWSLGTLVEWAQTHGFKVRVLFAESGLETLLGYWTDINLAPFQRKEPAAVPGCLAWHQQLTTPIGLAQLLKAADNVGKIVLDALVEAGIIEDDRFVVDLNLSKRAVPETGRIDVWVTRV
jgi:hypothetical protein